MYIITQLTILALPWAALSLPWDGPEPTLVNRRAGSPDADGMGWTPAPTPEPRAFFENLNPWKRQANSTILSSATVSHPTCGFYSGFTSYPWTCVDVAATCVSDAARSAFGCCLAPPACQLMTSCIPATSVSACGSDCAADPMLLKCGSSVPYCNQYVLADNTALATYWFCSDYTTIQTYFVSATDGGKRTITPVAISVSVAAKTTSLSSTTSSSTSSSSTSASTSASPTPTETSSPAKAPIGAIVGGVVGGIAVIAAIAVGVFFLLKRNKTTPPPAPAPIIPQPQPNYSQGGGAQEMAAGPVAGSSPYNQQAAFNQGAAAPAYPQEKHVYTGATPLPQQAQAYNTPAYNTPLPVGQQPHGYAQEISGSPVYSSPGSHVPPNSPPPQW